MAGRHSRREFMGLTAVGAAGILARPGLAAGRTLATTSAPESAQAAPSADPDLVVFNAKVYTMDSAAPRAEAFATSGGRFIEIGRAHV